MKDDGYDNLRAVTRPWTTLHDKLVEVAKTGKPATYSLMSNGEWHSVVISKAPSAALAAVRGTAMKVVINKCFGGFGLSQAAYERLIELGMPVKPCIAQKRGADGLWLPEPRNNGEHITDYMHPESTFEGRGIDQDTMVRMNNGRYHAGWLRDQPHGRTHALLVQVVEELGGKASDRLAALKVVEIPAGVEWEIEDYDGREHIAQKHQAWG